MNIFSVTAGMPTWAHPWVQVYAILAVCSRVCRLANWWHNWIPGTPQQDQHTAGNRWIY